MSDKNRSDSHERVALDLMEIIDKTSGLKPEQKDKEYWFTLYHQCILAVYQSKPAQIMKKSLHSGE